MTAMVTRVRLCKRLSQVSLSPVSQTANDSHRKMTFYYEANEVSRLVRGSTLNVSIDGINIPGNLNEEKKPKKK